jgi:hypothetical protein
MYFLSAFGPHVLHYFILVGGWDCTRRNSSAGVRFTCPKLARSSKGEIKAK